LKLTSHLALSPQNIAIPCIVVHLCLSPRYPDVLSTPPNEPYDLPLCHPTYTNFTSVMHCFRNTCRPFYPSFQVRNCPQAGSVKYRFGKLGSTAQHLLASRRISLHGSGLAGRPSKHPSSSGALSSLSRRNCSAHRRDIAAYADIGIFTMQETLSTRVRLAVPTSPHLHALRPKPHRGILQLQELPVTYHGRARLV